MHPSLSPKLLEPGRISGRVPDGVLNAPMPQVVLDQPRVRALVGQGEAASMAQHVGMSGQGKARRLAIAADRNPSHFAAQRAAAFADEEGVRLRLHPGAVSQPSLDRPQLIRAKGLGRGEAPLEPGHVQDPAFGVHLRESQPASLGDAQPMPEHEEQKAAVPGLVARALGGGQELFDLVAGQVFSVGHRFVQCLGMGRSGKPNDSGPRPGAH